MKHFVVETNLNNSTALKELRSGAIGGLGLGWLVLLVLVLLAPSTMKAQIGGTGTIEGTVTDTSGALVVGAKVTARNTATGAETVRTTTRSGLYTLSPLDAGDYTIEVSAPSFENLVRENIHLDGLQVLSLNLTLQVGAASQTVTVKDEPPPLETENATLGAAMENEVYQSLPLEMGAAGSADQRRATDFAALMPGVTANETKNNETDEPMVINGNQNSSEMYLEGIPMTSVSVAGDPRYIWSAFSVETVDQFQLKTSAYSAEYRGLGIENYTIKSGGNQFHGSVYDVLRNTAFDAIGFLPGKNPVTGAYLTSPPPEHMNEYGASLGGPIWKKKLFFFGNYLGFRFTTGTNPAFYTVPTTLMRTGNFSELLNPAFESTAQPIYDPITQTCVSSSNCSRNAYNAGTGSQGPGINGQTGKNVIPASEISPIAQAMEQYLPAPSNSSVTNNYLGSVNWGLNNWTQTERLDLDLSEKQKMSLIVGAGRQGLIGTVQGSATSTNLEPLPYQSGKIYRPITKDLMFEHTYVISNSLVNQIKYGAMQYYSPAINPSLINPAWAASAFGITGLPNGQVAQSFPTVKFSEVTQWGPSASAGNVTNNYVLLDNMQWIHGKHALSFGGQFQWLEYNFEADRTGTSPLTISLATKETEGFKGNNTVTALSNSGWDYASFMIGAIDSSTYTEYAPNATETGTRFHPFAFYVNDDFRVTNRLTINAGLRWDSLPPFHEAENRFSFLNPGATNPYTGSNGALEFAGSGGNSCHCSSPISTFNNNWGPRLGFAYSLGSKTVIRASAGMYYALGGGTGGTANSTQPGTALELGYSASPNPPSPGVVLPAFYLNGNSALSAQAGHKVLTYSNDPTNTSFGGVGYSVTAPPIYDPGYGTFYSTLTPTSSPDYISTTLGYLDPKFGGRAPEFTGWSFGFQRSVTRDMTATLSYVGNEGHHLLATGTTERGFYGNLLDPKWLALGANLSQTATSANLTANGLSLPYASFPTSQAFSQMLKPFPQYSGLTDEVDAVSNSNYHSLQLSINQRLAHGLTMMLNYTFSKSLDNAGTFRSGYAIPANVSADGNAYAQGKADYSLSGFDQRQDVTGTATYDLPFGRNHIGSDSAIVRSVAGGWRISGIFTYIGGNPLAIVQGTCTGNSVGEQCMPVLTPGFSGSARQNGGWGQGATRTNLSSRQYINPAAFTLSGTGGTLSNPYVIGNAARTAPYGLRGPGNYNIDTSLRRTFDIWNRENLKFVLEASAFNTGNHVWFGSTSTNGAGGAIGQSFTGTGTAFGAVTGQANNPRQFQFAGHVTF